MIRGDWEMGRVAEEESGGEREKLGKRRRVAKVHCIYVNKYTYM